MCILRLGEPKRRVAREVIEPEREERLELVDETEEMDIVLVGDLVGWSGGWWW